jgi:predicted dehydrogenase
MTDAAGAGPVGIGVVGAGKISEQYLANMRSFPDLDVRFVADLLVERAEAAAEHFGVPASGTLEQVLARDDVEIIVNLTLPSSHAEVARAALSSGKHVWNEKPFALDLESGTGLVEKADAAGLIIGTAPDTFLGPGWQATRRMVDRGDIGRPLTASMVFQTPGPQTWHPNPDFLFQAGGGPLFDMGPYYLTALAQVFGSVTRVAALGASSGPTRTIGAGPRAGETFDVGVATYVTAIYDFELGGVAAATFSFDSPLARVGVVEIAGTEATLAAPDPNEFGGDIRLWKTGDQHWQPVTAKGVEGGRGIGVVDMARALRSGERHRATGQLGLHVLDAMLATARSVDDHTFEPVDSRVQAVAPLPPGWDPTQRTV